VEKRESPYRVIQGGGLILMTGEGKAQKNADFSLSFKGNKCPYTTASRKREEACRFLPPTLKKGCKNRTLCYEGKKERKKTLIIPQPTIRHQ